VHATRDLRLIVCIDDEAIRRKCMVLLQDLAKKDQLATIAPRFRFETVCSQTRQQAMECLHHHLAAKEHHAVILLFDIPNDSVGDCRQMDSLEAAAWAEKAANGFKANCGTVAIMKSPRRLRNIDRVILCPAKSEQLLDTLKLITDKLSYTASPEKRAIPAPVEVRLIRRQHELLDYFRLRHRIYKIMGYLDAATENTASQMEIDWCDKISLHIGGYRRDSEQRQSLVGTARVVVGTAADARQRPPLLASYDEWVTRLAGQDPVLRQALIRGVLPLQLPIFQSQGLCKVFREALQRNEVCGELSRVIVTEDYRGTGLSGRLVKFALAEAAKIGVNRMFLECLDIHESLYCRLGFKRIEGTPGTVISVNQTMIGMEFSRRLGKHMTQAAS
jgi:GNAT superfamily N-acetyltransferase